VRPVEAACSGRLATIEEVALDSTLPGRRSPVEVLSWVKTPRFKVNKPRPACKVGDALDTELRSGPVLTLRSPLPTCSSPLQ
jgi:hypothetical protein